MNNKDNDFIERVVTKLATDTFKPYYHTDLNYVSDLVQFKNALMKRYKLNVSVEEASIIWKKLSISYSAQFMLYDLNLVNEALDIYING